MKGRDVNHCTSQVLLSMSDSHLNSSKLPRERYPLHFKDIICQVQSSNEEEIDFLAISLAFLLNIRVEVMVTLHGESTSHSWWNLPLDNRTMQS